MAHVLILQNLSFDGPGYLGDWLREQGASLEVRNHEAGDRFPESLAGYDALALLGGEMSANDNMPHLRRAEGLFREALQRGVPTLGHCLGGQLMSRALGASVHRSPEPEVGWHELSIDHPAAEPWFGARRSATVMQWHGEAFAVPAGVGAVAIASSLACPVQAWALGPHLAMQFHIEVDAEKVEGWCDEFDNRADRLRPRSATEHDTERVRDDTSVYLAEHQGIARGIYSHWLACVGR
jgi:GMP synthase (glutamine-hydrolysing)